MQNRNRDLLSFHGGGCSCQLRTFFDCVPQQFQFDTGQHVVLCAVMWAFFFVWHIRDSQHILTKLIS